VVWEGWRREVSPYPDHRRILVVAAVAAKVPFSNPLQTSIVVHCQKIEVC
jgi:hypothetical protein